MAMKQEYLYLDSASTTPPLKEVINEVARIENTLWANPNSIHYPGVLASEILERSRVTVADHFNVRPEQIIFTSGATDSISKLIRIISSIYSPSRAVISSVEHPSVIAAAQLLKESGWEVIHWPVDKYGCIRLDMAEEMLSPPTKFVSVIWGQSEIGTVQPISRLSVMCLEKNIFFHTDATQIIPHGRFNLDALHVSSITASSHKFRGIKGAGFIYLNDTNLDQFNISQEHKKQAFLFHNGTPPVSLIHGMSIALRSITSQITIDNSSTRFPSSASKYLTSSLATMLSSSNNLIFTGHLSQRLPNHISFLACTEDKEPLAANKIVLALSEQGIFISSGTACSNYYDNGSYVLKAIGTKPKYLRSSLRITLGNWIKELDLNTLSSKILSTIEQVQYL